MFFRANISLVKCANGLHTATQLKCKKHRPEVAAESEGQNLLSPPNALH